MRVGELNLDRTFGISQSGNCPLDFRLTFQGSSIRTVNDLDNGVGMEKGGESMNGYQVIERFFIFKRGGVGQFLEGLLDLLLWRGEELRPSPNAETDEDEEK